MRTETANNLVRYKAAQRRTEEILRHIVHLTARGVQGNDSDRLGPRVILEARVEMVLDHAVPDIPRGGHE
jgi:hypothetical protein